MGITRFPPSIVAKLSDLTDVDVTQSLTYPIGNGTFLVFDANTQTWKLVEEPGKFFAELVGKLFYRDASNGVTIKSLDAASVGDTDLMDGKTFTLVDSKPSEANAATSVTTGVTSMSQWFAPEQGTSATFNENISHYDTSSVTDMSLVFGSQELTDFNQNLQYWDVSNVQNFEQAFSRLRVFDTTSIESWDVSSAQNFSRAFEDITLNQDLDLSGWDMSSVRNAAEMFNSVNGSGYTINTSGWTFNLGGATSFEIAPLFRGNDVNVVADNWSFVGTPAFGASHFVPLDDFFGFGTGTKSMQNWNFSGLLVPSGSTLVFSQIGIDLADNAQVWPAGDMAIGGWVCDKPANELGAREFRFDSSGFRFANAPISNMSFKNVDVVDMSDMFNGFSYTPYNHPLNNWDFSNAGMVDLDEAFLLNEDFNQPLSTWNFTGATVSARDMFAGADAFNQDLSMWDFSGFSDLTGFLDGATSFSTANYDALLNRWADQVQNDGMATNLTTRVSATYSSAGAASRTYLINQGWSITDEGQV